MKQFKSLFLLECVIDALNSLSSDNELRIKIHGLLENLSSFDVITAIDLDIPDNPDPLLCVVNNILTRGTPTYPSIFIEGCFSESLMFSTKDYKRKYEIHYPLRDKIDKDSFSNEVFNALHLIDPTLKTPKDYLNIDDLDSDFEEAFMLNYIPIENAFLCQLFQHQRIRDTIGAEGNNEGRVDFSLEIPYSQIDARNNRFNQTVEIKNKKRYIVEVDGRRYHSALIDYIKDFEIARLHNNVSHIREDSVFIDAERMLSAVMEEDYVSIIESNFQRALSENKDILSLVLSPMVIARVQKLITQYLLVNIKNIQDYNEFKILIIERDLPCGSLAVDDLNELIKRLVSISNHEIDYPLIKADILPLSDFKTSNLHKYSSFIQSENVDLNRYDLIIDISALRRTGIAKNDYDYNSNKTAIIRSSYFVEENTGNPVYISNLIPYKAFTRHLSNEQHEIIEGASDGLRYFLQNIFRKVEFKDGQLPILNRALQNKPVIGLLPTGGGKSLTYQLASMLQPAITIVVDPIRSLMLDQYNGLRKAGIDRCEFLNSTQTGEERRYIQNKLLPIGELQFVFVSPERFVIKEFRNSLRSANTNGVYFGYCVIDEVHCVSEWGHDFRTPYLNLGVNAIEHCKTISDLPVTLFGLTATASFDVLADIERELQIPNDDGDALIRYENTVRNEINYSIIKVDGDFNNINVDIWNIQEVIGNEKLNNVVNLLENSETILNVFNTDDALKVITKKNYDDYLPDFEKPPYEDFLKGSMSDLKLNLVDFEYKELEAEYSYGSIVFCPHRKGAIGVRYFQEELTEELYNENIGYFMGSSDDLSAKRVDRESFDNLEKFVSNQQSIMVATKAFGMGIDKPNVRSTIHINIPQSIESFVQEAGRSGRDKKLSISHILYNNQYFELDNKLFNLDKDILLYFHKNSFKGKIKERQTLFELRTRISFPNTNRLQQLNGLINDSYAQDGVEFELQLGNNNWVNFLFVKTQNHQNVGSVNIHRRFITIINEINNEGLCQEVLNEINTQIPFYQLNNVNDVRNWLLTQVVNEEHEIGIENRLPEMANGESTTIQVPFINRYYSTPKRSYGEFRLNGNHFEKVKNNPIISKLLNDHVISDVLLRTMLSEAVFNSKTYDEFVESLILEESIQMEFLDNMKLQRDYYIPRSQDDTAKGVYRLSSIGIIDTYTIDYQNKLYNISFTKKNEDEYFDNLEKIFMRYTSSRMSQKLIEEVKGEFLQEKEENNATAISICLKNLTDFVYEKVQRKRLQAIEDMIDLCETYLVIDDPIKQSLSIKDEIYYYFNAKYSRFGNEAIINGAAESASMPDDREELDFAETIWKYIKIVEEDETGEFKNNIKHLRGATMRMLRSYPNEPHYLILKAFSLIILSDVIPILSKEGINEMVKGLVAWREIISDLEVIPLLNSLKNEISNHIELANIEQIFNDIEDLYFSQYYLQWTQNFSNNFLKNY